jgi:hypothetical protein
MKYVANRFRIISGINRILLTEKLGPVDAWARQSEAFLAAKAPRINDISWYFSDYSASWKQAASLGTLAATGHVSPNRLSPSRRISKADA